MEKKLETTKAFWGYVRDNGKETGNPGHQRVGTVVAKEVSRAAAGSDPSLSYRVWEWVLPRQPVAPNCNLPSPNFLLLWVKVPHYYGER